MQDSKHTPTCHTARAVARLSRWQCGQRSV